MIRRSATGADIWAYETFIGEVFGRLAEQGFDDMRPAHAQVTQNLTEEGVRLTDR